MRSFLFGLWVSIVASGALRAGVEFDLKLQVENAHLREVFLGCRAGATDGYDRKIDDFAPPPGIEVGYIGFLPPPDSKLPYFYRDIRAPGDLKEWRLTTKVFTGKPMVISWEGETLPPGCNFTLVSEAGEIDMAKKTSITLDKGQTLVILAMAMPSEVVVGETKAEKKEASAVEQSPEVTGKVVTTEVVEVKRKFSYLVIFGVGILVLFALFAAMKSK